MQRLLDSGWQPSEIQALREAIHNHHQPFEDGLLCCEADPGMEVCPAHSLLDDPDVLTALLWWRRLYRVMVKSGLAYEHKAIIPVSEQRRQIHGGEQRRPGPLVQ